MIFVFVLFVHDTVRFVSVRLSLSCLKSATILISLDRGRFALVQCTAVVFNFGSMVLGGTTTE